MKRIIGHEPVAGGFMVTVEVPFAYTDGTSRIDRVFVADADVRGKTTAQQQHAIHQAATVNPLEGVIGQNVVPISETWEMKMLRLRGLFDEWQMWKLSHAEAVVRARPANEISGLLVSTNNAWTAYMDALWAPLPL